MDVYKVINVNKNNYICSICLNDFIKSKKVYQCVQCKNQFHIDCVKEWFKYKKECPNCRLGSNYYDLDFEIIYTIIICVELQRYNQVFYYYQYIFSIFIFVRNIILFIIFYFFIIKINIYYLIVN